MSMTRRRCLADRAHDRPGIFKAPSLSRADQRNLSAGELVRPARCKGLGCRARRAGKVTFGRSDIGGDPIVAVLAKSVSDAHLAGLRSEGVSYVFAGETELDLPLVLDILNRDLGVKRLLVEGGGITNGNFLRAGLIDEIHLILNPAVDGTRDAPSAFDSRDEGPRKAPLQKMILESSRPLEAGALWLRYRVENQ
jgi:riboflavin biosynthesis pyrimidine reductase